MRKLMLGACSALVLTGLAGAAGLAAAAQAQAAQAQVGKVHRIAMLSYAPGEETMQRIKQGLQRYGYYEGENVVYMLRSGVRNGDPTSGAKDITDRDVVDIIAWKPDLIVSLNTNSGMALKKNPDTAQFPVVLWGGAVVDSGFADSYKRPGHNMTGRTSGGGGNLMSLRFFKTVIPNLKKVGYMYNDGYSIAPEDLRELQEVTQLMGLELHVYNTFTREEFEPTIAKMKADGMQMLKVGPHELFNVHGEEIGRLALKYGLPATGQGSVIRGGGVMAGGGGGEGWEASYPMMDAILQGRSRPAEMAFIRGWSHSMMIHKAHADQLGLRIPEALLDEAETIVQ